MDYVITLIFWNADHTDSKFEKRFTDKEHLDKCIISCKQYAKRYINTFDCSGYEIHKNKCYMCLDGYLYTGDYICQIV